MPWTTPAERDVEGQLDEVDGAGESCAVETLDNPGGKALLTSAAT